MGLLSRLGKQAAKELDMAPEPRLARAREMGFDVDTPLYHGTDASGFDAFDPRQIGAAQDGKLFGGRGFYFADNASDARGYGKNTVKVVVRGEVADLRDPETLAKFFADEPVSAYNGQTLRQLQEVYDRTRAAVKVEDVLVRESRFPALMEVQYKVNGEWKPVGQHGLVSKLELSEDPSGMAVALKDALPPNPKDFSLSQVTSDEITRAAKRAGVSGVKIPGSIGMRGDEVVIFDPANIRRTDAKFDPAQEGSSKLLAAVPAAIGGGLLSRWAMQPEDYQV